MKPASVLPCFPNTTRGVGTPLKTDPKRNLVIYALDRTVVIREIVPSEGRPIHAQLYTQHGYPVTAVAMSPSGSFVASGDTSGVVRIWACDNPDQILKLETPMLGGKVLDLAWSGDGQRVVAVGEGRESFAKVIMWDSGNTVGDMPGHSKKINSVAFKPSRPFRIATGGEDTRVNFYSGPPFKLNGTLKSHDRFVNCVRYSPDGSRIVSAGSDMVVAVYDGAEGALTLEKKVHAGSVYSSEWSRDGTQVATASADKTVKVFEASTLDTISSVTFGTTVNEMQVGCVWAAAGILSYSLGGSFSLVEPATGQILSTQVGHNRNIATLAWAEQAGRLLSGSFADLGDGASLTGVVRCWDLSTGMAAPFSGAPHANRVLKIGVLADGAAVSAGLDNSLLVSCVSPPAHGARIALPGCPKDMGVGSAVMAVVTTDDKLVLATKDKTTAELKLEHEPTCVAVAPSDAVLAVGSSDHNVRLLDLAGKVRATLAQHKGSISCVAFSADSSRVASGCANKEIVVWDAVAGAPLVTGLSGFHTTRISCLVFSPAGLLASGGVDGAVFVWDGKAVKHKMPLAHAGGVSALAFLSGGGTLASAGLDACIKTWTI